MVPPEVERGEEQAPTPRSELGVRAALDALGQRKLVVVTGKGGVGKSAVASALGRLFAEGGRRVLVLEVDPRENVHQMFGIPPSGGEIVHAGGHLHLQNLKPRQVLDTIIREQVKIGAVARRVLESPIYEQFAAGMPGLKEVALASHALRMTEGDRKQEAFDLVILDAPATGHGVTLLAAPLLVSEAIPGGPVGRMARRLAELVADPGRSGIVVVTLAEEMPVDEALELRGMLAARLGREPEILVANGLYPEVPAELAASDDPAVDLWCHRRRINEDELRRIRASWRGPIAHLPLLPLDPGPALVDELARRLGDPSAPGGAP